LLIEKVNNIQTLIQYMKKTAIILPQFLNETNEAAAISTTI